MQDDVLKMMYKLDQGLNQLKVGMYFRNLKEMIDALNEYSI